MRQVTSADDPLFVFVDESGDLHPCLKGSDSLVLSAFATKRPDSVSTTLNSLRYQLLSKGVGIPNFHAADDSRIIRAQFLLSLQSLTDCQGISLALRKTLKMSTSDLKGIYVEILSRLISEIIQSAVQYSQIVLLVDLTLDRTSRAAAKRKLKQLFLSLGIKNYVYFQSMKRDACGQVADYLAWSHFQSFERGSDEYLKKVIKAIDLKVSEFDDPLG